MIDIGDLDYEWQLEEAAKSLMKFVKQFDLSEIGLTYKVMDHVCPEANEELFQCISDDAKASVDSFYNDCLDYITEIFQKGANDLKIILGNLTYFQGKNTRNMIN